jgi:ADP-ribose pyrophosphatase
MSVDDTLSYLSRLPTKAQYKGSANNGEIELINNSNVISELLETLKERLICRGFGSNRFSLGIVFEDDRIVVVRDPVLFPSGATGTYLRIFERPALDGLAGVVIVPIREGMVWLRWNFRHPTRTWELECPRGYRHPGANAEQTAITEVREELGFEVEELHEVGSIYSNTGILASEALAFVATLKQGTPVPQPELGEAFGEMVALSPAELHQYIVKGTIRDGFTLSALQLASSHGFLLVQA